MKLLESLRDYMYSQEPQPLSDNGEPALTWTVATFPAKDIVGRVISALSGAETEIIDGLIVKASKSMQIQTKTEGKRTTLSFSPAPKLTASKLGFYISATLDQFSFTEDGGQFVLDGLPDFEIRFN